MVDVDNLWAFLFLIGMNDKARNIYFERKDNLDEEKIKCALGNRES